MNSGALSKKQAHLQPGDPADWGDAWMWRALALPSHLRVVTHLSHERSEEEATAFLAAFKARTDRHAPLFPRDKLPAYVAALIANYSTPEPPPAQRGRGRPRQTPRRVVETALLLKGCSKFCRLCITNCRISSKAIVWPEKPGIIERQKHHVRNSLKMLDSLKWVVFGKDGPYARA